jgi:hypothetical protein
MLDQIVYHKHFGERAVESDVFVHMEYCRSRWAANVDSPSGTRVLYCAVDVTEPRAGCAAVT